MSSCNILQLINNKITIECTTTQTTKCIYKQLLIYLLFMGSISIYLLDEGKSFIKLPNIHITLGAEVTASQ